MDSRVVRPYGRKTLAFAAASLILTALFAWIIIDSPAGTDISFAYFLGAIFGLSALLGIAILLPGSTFVRADTRGIEVRFFWIRAFSLEWPDIERVTFETIGENVVRIVLTPRGQSKNRRSLFQQITRGSLGNERGLPDVFSIPSAELARLLNDMRNRYGHA